MDTNNSSSSTEPSEQVNSHETLNQQAKQSLESETSQRSLVPRGITVGLAMFALVLSLAGYGFRLMVGDDVETVLRHAAVIVPAFMLGIPLFFWVGSRILNKVKGLHIESWNAISLGYLTSCISMLWLMGTYS
jgi:cation transport ATPase